MPIAQHGDVVRVTHKLYDHYGIYVKASTGARVIHYTGENGPQDFNGMVRETPIGVFLNGEKKYTVCEFDPRRYRTIYSGAETVERARSRLGQKGYNLVTNNCEHFAVWCKTGRDESSQVRDLSCHAIIHTASAACAAVGGGLAQLPLSDAIPITTAQVTMVIGLGQVFGKTITDAGAKAIIASMSSAAIGRFISQCLVGWIPVMGNFINATTAAGITESLGWAVVEKFESEMIH